MPPLPFFAELNLRREFDSLLEVQFLYTGHPEHSEKVIQKLERICMRLLKTQIPAVYVVEEDVATCSDPAMVDVVLRRERLTDNHVVWLKNHLRRGFEKRALSKYEHVQAMEENNSVRWVTIPKSGYEKTAQRAVRENKTRRKSSRKCRKRSNLSV